MEAIYRIVTTIAALVVIVIGGTWFGAIYEVGPKIDWWEPTDWKTALAKAKENDGIPKDGPGEISIPIATPFGMPTWKAGIGDTRILPVYFESAPQMGFDEYRQYDNQFFAAGGQCEVGTVNILVISQEHPEGTPLFNSRVLIPRFFYFEDAASKKIVALVVRTDSNRDGKLDCGDEAEFSVISLDTGEAITLDRKFVSENISRIFYRDTDRTFGFSEMLYLKDEVSVRSIRISLDDMSLTETVAPDLLSKAREAFNNVESGDLK